MPSNTGAAPNQHSPPTSSSAASASTSPMPLAERYATRMAMLRGNIPDLDSLHLASWKEWDIWEERLLRTASERSLLAHFTGASSRPQGDAVKEKAWDAVDAEARALLSSRVEWEYMNRARGSAKISTARDLFDRVKALAAKDKTEAKVACLMTYQGLRMDEHEDLGAYLRAHQDFRKQAHDLGIAGATDEYIASAMLIRLPPSYRAFAVAKMDALAATEEVDFWGVVKAIEAEARARQPAEANRDPKSAPAGSTAPGAVHSAKTPSDAVGIGIAGSSPSGTASGQSATRKNKKKKPRPGQQPHHQTADAASSPAPAETPFAAALDKDTVWGEFVVSTATGNHVCGDGDFFQSLTPATGEVTGMAGGKLRVTGIGPIVLEQVVDGKVNRLRLPEVHYVPGLRDHVLSAAQLQRENDLSISFEQDECRLDTQQGETKIMAPYYRRLPTVRAKIIAPVVRSGRAVSVFHVGPVSVKQ